jgi:hypothetical protein
MQDQPRISTDQPVINVLQIVALNTICVVLAVTGLKLFAFSWGTAIFLGWLGAMPFTLVIAVGIIFLTARRRGDAAPNETPRQRFDMMGAPPSGLSTAAHIEMWQEDVLEDDWGAVAEIRQRRGAQGAGEVWSDVPTEQRRRNTR